MGAGTCPPFCLHTMVGTGGEGEVLGHEHTGNQRKPHLRQEGHQGQEGTRPPGLFVPRPAAQGTHSTSSKARGCTVVGNSLASLCPQWPWTPTYLRTGSKPPSSSR